jgi:CheY-like chemotaxis protein
VARERILIVEDECVTALHLRQQLNRLGYEVGGSVTSGEEAVRVAEELRPDLVIMDVKLAGVMDGVEASRRIQEKVGAPVVYMTAYPDIFLRAPAGMQQPRICISKPFSAGDLRDVIEIALRS